ncbi:hypothetical protein BSKO_07915 [Bryopsis sp. KO-2023]|nr:hypothetical protein BSKO_07915 [Bryopsis sp. KO-2023]
MVLKALVLLSLLITQRCAAQAACATTCFELDCRVMTIRYGKYCGVGHTGCKGEKPCDGVDGCCKIHDECVVKNNVLDNKCHSEFITCLKRQQASKRKGFSKKCPLSVVIPTMENGIIAAMAMGNLVKGFSDEL